MQYMDYPDQSTMSQFMYKVYGWMTLGLAVTGGFAYYLASVPGLTLRILSQPILFFGIFILQLALVLCLSFLINHMNFMTAFLCFILYALSLGVTLSIIFLAYEISSIYVTFLVTALTFGIMCIYGYFTRADLTTIGNLCTMALFGLIIAMLVNLFLKSQTMDFILSGIGVIIFTLLTAFDSQRIKQMAMQLWADRQNMDKVALLGALTLYLDFINLFLFLLQFLGRKKE